MCCLNGLVSEAFVQPVFRFWMGKVVTEGFRENELGQPGSSEWGGDHFYYEGRMS